MEKQMKAKGRECGESILVENRVYTAEEAAGILHVHARTIRRMCASGVLKCGKMRKPLLITGWVLRDFLESDQFLPLHYNCKNISEKS